MHEIESDQLGEAEWTFDDPVGLMSEAQQDEGDERDVDLNAHGILGSSEEVADLQGLLDPPEKQPDLPTPLVQVGNPLRGGPEVVGGKPQNLTAVDRHLDLANRARHRV